MLKHPKISLDDKNVIEETEFITITSSQIWKLFLFLKYTEYGHSIRTLIGTDWQADNNQILSGFMINFNH